MSELWKAFVTRIVYWFTPKLPEPKPVPVPEPKYSDFQTPPLKPGMCECGHVRCAHVGGKGKCCSAFPPNDNHKDWWYCGCQVFIPAKDNGDDSSDPQTPSPEELEKLYSK